jgi:hypothetical protein
MNKQKWKIILNIQKELFDDIKPIFLRSTWYHLKMYLIHKFLRISGRNSGRSFHQVNIEGASVIETVWKVFFQKQFDQFQVSPPNSVNQILKTRLFRLDGQTRPAWLFWNLFKSKSKMQIGGGGEEGASHVPPQKTSKNLVIKKQ